NLRDLKQQYKNLQHINASSPTNIHSFENIYKNIITEKFFLKKKTIESYKAIWFGTIQPFLEYHFLVYIDDFKREHSIEFFKFLLNKGCKKTTRKKYYEFFKSFFEYATNNNLIEKNLLFLPKMKQELILNANINPFSLDEALNLVKNAQGDLKTYLALAFFTGARTGEILALTFKDINLQTREITINKTLSETNIIDSPKTLSSNRVIDMLDIVYNHLKNLKYQSLEQRVIALPRHTLRKQFDDLQNKLKLQRRRLYDTRHSFASIMLSKGEEPMWVGCKMMGHKDLTETYKTYAKYLPKEVAKRATFLQGIEI
uniref:tyrosine-type recombinase/integrase n=4 Tax=Helicobacteraceae TaxID=72293 RepID=UPI003A8A93BD